MQYRLQVATHGPISFLPPDIKAQQSSQQQQSHRPQRTPRLSLLLGSNNYLSSTQYSLANRRTRTYEIYLTLLIVFLLRRCCLRQPCHSAFERLTKLCLSPGRIADRVCLFGSFLKYKDFDVQARKGKSLQRNIAADQPFTTCVWSVTSYFTCLLSSMV